MLSLPGIRGDVAEFTWGDHSMLALDGHFDAANPGVGRQFLEDSAIYAARYNPRATGPSKIEVALQGAGLDITPKRIPDVGAGPGATALAMAERWPDARIVASDLSPAMVARLNHALDAAALNDRVTAIVMDASRVQLEPNAFDLIVGSSMLHHLVDPFTVVERLLAALAPGGAAIFYEPFQVGNFVLRQAMSEVLRTSAFATSPLPPEIRAFFETLTLGIDIVSADARDNPILTQLDDKWLFTRSQFEAVAQSAGARLTITPMKISPTHFADKIADLIFKGLGSRDPLPDWAHDIIRSYDAPVSAALRKELLTEGSIVFAK